MNKTIYELQIQEITPLDSGESMLHKHVHVYIITP